MQWFTETRASIVEIQHIDTTWALLVNLSSYLSLSATNQSTFPLTSRFSIGQDAAISLSSHSLPLVLIRVVGGLYSIPAIVTLILRIQPAEIYSYNIHWKLDWIAEAANCKITHQKDVKSTFPHLLTTNKTWKVWSLERMRRKRCIN